MSARNEECSKCLFWELETHDDWEHYGYCLRNPPTFVSSGKAEWPTTWACDWCGEFSPKAPFNPTEAGGNPA